MDPRDLDALLTAALDEDRGGGDITSDSVVPAGTRARASLTAKAHGRLAGLGVFARVFELCDPGARIELQATDGDAVAPGDAIARVEGDARGLLLAERTALNFLQRLSGVATLTARFVEAAAGRARILDTRKTTPGLRALQKHAVRCGGGENHRFGLFDEAMLKDNHFDMADRPAGEVVADLRAKLGPDIRITAEARDREEALAAARAGADVVMLDNMEPEEMARLCPEVRAAAPPGRGLEIEASGGIGPDEVARVAAAGVDRISVGALTHSAPALDLSLALERLP